MKNKTDIALFGHNIYNNEMRKGKKIYIHFQWNAHTYKTKSAKTQQTEHKWDKQIDEEEIEIGTHGR